MNCVSGWFASHREEFLRDLTALIAIPSVKGKSEHQAPYGSGPALALEFAVSLARSFGLEAYSLDGRAAIVELGSPGRLDILAHLDVVDGGSGWSITKPFEARVVGDRFYGRGAMDDKGPALAALYAMRCLKELRVRMDGGVRLMLGLDEESGSSDLKYYRERFPEAEYTFTPDAHFPLVNAEKGGFFVDFYSMLTPAEPTDLVYLKAGTKGNVIPGESEATIRGLGTDILKKALRKTPIISGIGIDVSGLNETSIIHVYGTPAHAARPEKGENALTALLSILAELPMPETPRMRAVSSLSRFFPHGKFDGDALNIALSDDETGALTASLTMLSISDTGLDGHIDARIPLCAAREQLLSGVALLENAGFAVQHKYIPAHYVPRDSRLCKTILRCYEQVAGKKSYTLSEAGMTYAHGIRNAVAFGCTPDGLETNIHGADEFAPINTLLMSGEIFAMVIKDLCSEKYGNKKGEKHEITTCNRSACQTAIQHKAHICFWYCR